MDRANAANQAQWEEYQRVNQTPFKGSEFAALSMDSNLERVCHAVFNRAHFKWTSHGIKSLTVGERTVIAVEKFFEECCNGGLLQYLTNESGTFARDLPEALVRVDLPAYAPLVLDLLRALPNPFPRDSNARHEAAAALEYTLDSDPVGRANDRFFELYGRDGPDLFRQRLHKYIFSHPSEFVSGGA